MFCLRAPLDSDNQLPKSEKNLSEFSSNTKLHSDSNIPISCENSGSKRRERWEAKLQTGSPLKNRNKENHFERKRKSKEFFLVTETGNSFLPDSVKLDVLTIQTSLEKKVKFENESLDLGFVQSRDIDFIDESKSGSQENVGKEKYCLGNDETGNCVAESENYCPKNKKSITDLKAVKHLLASEVIEETFTKDNLIRNESKQNFSNQTGSQVVLHFNSHFDVICKSESFSDTNLLKSSNKSLKHQKINSGTSFLSLCSLFSLSKSGNKSNERMYSKNNETEFQNQNTPFVFHQNLTSGLSCCPLSFQKTKLPFVEELERNSKHPTTSFVIINKSPKPKNKTLFSDDSCDGSLVYKCGSLFSSKSSSIGTLSDGIVPMASPEVISPSDSVLSCPNFIDFSSSKSFRVEFKESFREPSSFWVGPGGLPAKFKLLHEGDAQVCFLTHTKTIFRKVLSSKLLRRWETHHIYLRDDCLCSKTPTGCLESPVPYSTLDEVYVVGRWDNRNRFCIRLVMAEGSLLLQTSNSLVRDQWLSSILWKKNMHKYRNILQTSTRPEVVLKEIKSLIYSSLNSPLQDVCIRSIPIEIISKSLNVDEIWNDRQRTEEVIVALVPLLEDANPSPEMLRFFSRHCLSHPRSPVVVEVFMSVVQRILKRTMDFGKSPLKRRFVADYFKALYSQNERDEAIRKFIASVHGTTCRCPHPRVLPNLVAVNLAALFSHFEQRKTLLTELPNEGNSNEALQILDKQIECFASVFITISNYEDWRPGLAQLLQPIPFPDDALSHDAFIKGFVSVIKTIGTDPRCEVHEMILGIRENKEGWLNVFCPSSLVCKDEGVLWCQMLKTLFNCCCRRKSFLLKMVKHLGALLLVALRGHLVAQEMLCLMLEWRLLSGEDQEMQIVTTLQSNETGRQKYSELCKRQEHLKELQKEGGPKKLTLPSRSTDADVARLLSCGSFGNLECLSLAFTHVTSACAHQLIQLPGLRYLNLWATQFGDAGLVIIAEHLDKLQVLNLCETPVSDKGIAAVAAMRSLKKLNLNSTKLSPQTLDTLKMKLPTLQELDVRYTDAW